MFRKFALAIVATAALGAAALSPTAASAHHWGNHWGHGFGFGYYGGPTYIAAPDCYRVKRIVQFADGSWGKRWFTVCN
jgi:hypothetical protein